MRTNQSQENEYLKQLSSVVDVDHIRHQWMSLSPPYDVDNWMLPLPLWAKRSFDLSPSAAWQALKTELQISDPQKPFCIYIHIPFCTKKCDFCDSYSFKVGSHKEEVIKKYVDRLCDELILWSEQGNLSDRPVSTVHLGGGTPNFVGSAALKRILECCKTNFNVSPQTEWALEATVEALSPETIDVMDELGFRRLHVGVQSLQEDVRSVIGRRRPSHEVLEKIHNILELDWIVTVDLLCGLPFQTIDSLITDIKTLAAAGVNGFSLYELLIYPQNARWAQRHQLVNRSHLPNYFAFQAGALILEELGYEKNLFNHWADDRDKNIYFTFPTRKEDCLAIGTIADGIFGNLHYRHPKYAPYMRTSKLGFPGLEGGLRQTAYENLLNPFITAILSGWIKSDVISQFAKLANDQTEFLLDHWQKLNLVEARANSGLRLTANGSWFAGNMVSEVTQQFVYLEEKICPTPN